MTNKNETIADIIAEMRDWLGDANSYDLRSLADRLEAAWKREKAEAVGDCAKMREALEFSDKELRKATEDDKFGDDPVYLVGCMRTVANVCRAALAAPTRNCDRFATLEDARKEHHKICEEYGACNKACGYKSGHSGTYQCFEAWLFAPVTEQEGENDEQK